MENIVKSDIFFFVTTIMVVVITIVVVVLAAYAVRIMSDVKDVSKKIKEESGEFINDARELRIGLKEKGSSLLGLVSLIFGTKKRSETRRKKQD